MTAAMFDRMGDQTKSARVNPNQLRPGTLVYLWEPDEQPWLDKPILARVERATVSNIVSVDTAPNPVPDQPPVRRVTPVGPDVPIGLRWTWEVAAPPQRPTMPGGIEVLDAPADVAQRAELLCGEPGAKLKVTLINGEVVHGMLTRLLMGQCSWEAEWGELVDVDSGRGHKAIHSIRIEHVSKISRFEDV